MLQKKEANCLFDADRISTFIWLIPNINYIDGSFFVPVLNIADLSL